MCYDRNELAIRSSSGVCPERSASKRNRFCVGVALYFVVVVVVVVVTVARVGTVACESTFSKSVMRTESGGGSGTTKFEHLCSQCSTVCDFFMQIGLARTAAEFNKWSYALRSGMCFERC